MTEIFFALLSMALFGLGLLMFVGFLRVARAGPGRVAYLRRKNYGLGAWATGQLPKTSDGTTVHELEGLELKAKGGRLSYVRRTRAPTAEI